jgi:hypothetical protein
MAGSSDCTVGRPRSPAPGHSALSPCSRFDSFGTCYSGLCWSISTKTRAEQAASFGAADPLTWQLTRQNLPRRALLQPPAVRRLGTDPVNTANLLHSPCPRRNVGRLAGAREQEIVHLVSGVKRRARSWRSLRSCRASVARRREQTILCSSSKNAPGGHPMGAVCAFSGVSMAERPSSSCRETRWPFAATAPRQVPLNIHPGGTSSSITGRS